MNRTVFRLAVLVLVALALVACSQEQGASDGPTYGAVALEGPALPEYEPGTEPAAGSPVPSFTTQNPAGEEVTFQPGSNPTVLVFLAHWCSHCQAELPRLVDWLAANPQDGVDIYAVATGIDAGQPNFPPSAWLEDEGWDQPVALDSESSDIAQAYGLASFPFWAVVDGAGNLVGRAAGEVGDDGFAALFQAAQS